MIMVISWLMAKTAPQTTRYQMEFWLMTCSPLMYTLVVLAQNQPTAIPMTAITIHSQNGGSYFISEENITSVSKLMAMVIINDSTDTFLGLRKVNISRRTDAMNTRVIIMLMIFSNVLMNVPKLTCRSRTLSSMHQTLEKF